MNRVNKSEEFDTYEIEEPSDEERASSSEDELDVLLNGTPDQKRKLIREYLTGESESSSGDEFEKEMEAELSSTMRTMETTWAPPVEGEGSAPPGGGGETGPLPAAQPMMYDQVYFDSDSDEENKPCGSKGRRRSQRRIMTNDELLYDPDEDDRDQAWVDARRRQYIRSKPLCSGARPAKLQALPSSDAVLNCPACMTTLCLDCQRHERYRTQYRAMFVLNCAVKTDEVLCYTSDGGGSGRRRGRGRKRRAGQMELGGAVTTEGDRVPGRPRGLGTDELYRPVLCTECSTQVAVYDQHEVYHFFNILASHC